MKFLFISPRFSGGIGGHAAMLADQLVQAGHEVTKMKTSHIPIKNLKNPSFAIFGTNPAKFRDLMRFIIFESKSSFFQPILI